MEKARLYFVDNLRVLLITMVIVLHLSSTYGGEWFVVLQGGPGGCNYLFAVEHSQWSCSFLLHGPALSDLRLLHTRLF